MGAPEMDHMLHGEGMQMRHSHLLICLVLIVVAAN